MHPPKQQLQNLATLYGQGKFSQGVKEGEALAKQFPKSPLVRNLLGAFYNGLKKPGKAEQNFKAAITINPIYAEGHSNLGSFYSGLNKYEQAIACYERALEIKPNFADAHRNLGNVLSASGKYTAALKHFKEAVKLEPRNVLSHVGLASTLQACRNNAGALASYKAALKIDPNNVSALIGAGVTKSALADVQGAADNYKAALKIDPNHAVAHNNLGVALRELGDMKKSLFHGREAVRLDPTYVNAYRNLGLIDKYAPDDERITTMEKLSKKSLSDINMCHLGFALGKAYDDIDDTRKAFEWFKRGNALRKKELRYTIETDQKLFAQIKDVFENDDIGTLTKAQQNTHDKKPIFIVGMPRSGTSLVEQILDSHSQIYGAGELDYMWRSVSASQWQKQRPDAALMQGIAQRYHESLKRLNINEPYITDKMPINFRWVGFIISAFPQAKIIHVKRDARATCWSIFKQYFSLNGNGFAYDLDDLCAYYKLYTDLMDFWRARYADRIYNLSYDALSENQEEETRKLLQHIGLNWEEGCLSFHENERAVRTASTQQVRQKMYKGSSKEWERYRAFLTPVFDPLNSL